MKKGFTLIELIAIIVVIGVLGVITMPVVSNVIVKNQEKAHNAQITFIENATKMWAVYNTVYDTEYVTVQELIDGGYIEQDKILDPATKKDMVGCVKVTFNETYNQYEYKFGEYDECGIKTYYIEPENSSNPDNYIWINSYTTGTILENKYCIDDGSINTCRLGLKDYIFDTASACEEALSTGSYGDAECVLNNSIVVNNGYYVKNYNEISGKVFLKIEVKNNAITGGSICVKYDGIICLPVFANSQNLEYKYDNLRPIAVDYTEYDSDMIPGGAYRYILSNDNGNYEIFVGPYEYNGITVLGDDIPNKRPITYKDSCELIGGNHKNSHKPYQVGTLRCSNQ